MKDYEDLTIEDKVIFITDVMSLPCTIDLVMNNAIDIVKKEKLGNEDICSKKVIEKVFDQYAFYHTKYGTFKKVYNTVKDIVDRISEINENISIENILDYAEII